MERYFLEKSITDFFNGRNSTNKLELIYAIINEVEIFNTINPFDMEIDLLEIETEVLDILSSDVTTDEIEYLIMSKYKESIIYKFKEYGLVISDESYLYEIKSVLEVFNTIFSMDKQLLDSILYELESDLSDIDILLRIVSDISTENLYSILVDVQSSFLMNIKNYILNLPDEEDIDPSVYTSVEALINKNIEFAKSHILLLYFKGQLVSQDIDTLLPYFYQYSDYHGKDLTGIARELYIIYYLANPKIENIKEDYVERIDFSLIKSIGESQKLEDEFKMIFENIVSETERK